MTILSLIEEFMKETPDSGEGWEKVSRWIGSDEEGEWGMDQKTFEAVFIPVCTAFIEQDRKLREAVAALEFIKMRYMQDAETTSVSSLAVEMSNSARNALQSILPLNS